MAESTKVSFSELYPILKEQIDSGNNFVFTAFGKSMYPFIKGGRDRVTLSPIGSKPKKNDIIFYRRKNGAFVLHRIVKKAGETYQLCGDNQYYIEKGIETGDIIARLTEIERKNKKIDPYGIRSRLWCFFLPARRFLLHVIAYIKSKMK
jgi:hypothetical protein